MRLCLRAQDIAWFSFALTDKQGRVQEAVRHAGPPERIFSALGETLAAWGIPWKELTSVALVSGPGSYTATRGSVTIGNTIAFVRNVPVGALPCSADASDEAVFLKLAKIKARVDHWALPVYGAPPRITKPRK